MKIIPSSIAVFARDVLGKPLYPYQAEVAEAILTSIVEGQGRIFTVMMTLPALAGGRTRRDSTVITIVRVTYNELNLPVVEVVHHAWWTGMPYLDQYAATLALVEQWGIRTLVLDATGLGGCLASLLVARLGEQRVKPFTFSRPSKSHLAYHLLAQINSGRLKLYATEQAPRTIFEECRQQLRKARYRLPEPDILDFYVDPHNGHDDFLSSLSLVVEAVTSVRSLPAISVCIPPPRLFADEGTLEHCDGRNKTLEHWVR